MEVAESAACAEQLGLACLPGIPGKPSPSPLPHASVGDLVEVRGDRWQVSSLDAYGTCVACALRGVGRFNLGEHRTLLAPFDRVRAVSRPAAATRVERWRAVLALRALVAASPPCDGLREALWAKVDVLPYQLEPVLACVGGVARLLLADEVGLGKTVQAALIIAELRARAEASRVLVVCPVGICGQWKEELQGRFGIDAAVIDSAALRQLTAVSTLEDGPWHRVPTAIVSMDFVKQPEVLRGLASTRWDLVVVDEAHLVATARERGAAVQWLASRAPRVVLLTATPHPGLEGAFAALCSLGRLPAEEPILMFRRTRATLGLPAARHDTVLHVRLSAEERRLHSALETYASRVSSDRHGLATSEARLAMSVLRKRAASGPSPLLASLRRRLSLLASADGDVAVQLALPIGDDRAVAEEEADDAPGMVLAAPGLADGEAERRLLERLVLLAQLAVPTDRKLAALRRLLCRARQPTLVFTEYRDTLEWLADNLSTRFRVAILHGGLTQPERAESVRAFVTGTADLLLATDAAAHGLNLHPRSRLVVNVELPWNPVRLEQRVGRLDRIGQQRRVHAVHLVGGKAEMQVLRQLLEKVERARTAVGMDQLVLGRRPGRHRGPGSGASPATASADPTLPDGAPGHRTVASRFAELGQREAARTRSLRRLLVGPPAASAEQVEQLAAEVSARGPWQVADAGSLRIGGRILFLFGAPLTDGRGLTLEQVLVPITVTSAIEERDAGENREALQQAVIQSLLAVARERVDRRRSQLACETARSTALALVREERIAALLRLRDRAPVQGALFDRRAAREREARDEQDARERGLEQERQERLRLASRVTAGKVELLLVLPLGLDPEAR